MSSNTFHLVSLGCAKNTVDSEFDGAVVVPRRIPLSGAPRRSGRADRQYLRLHWSGQATNPSRRCAHSPAKKRDGQILIASGCLTQRYGAEVAQAVPGIDGILGTRRWMDIVGLVRELRQSAHPEPLYHIPSEAVTVGTDEAGIVRASVSGASAYLKIADGCRRPCAFCAIPLIKGTAVSRPLERILDEARPSYETAGVRELILIAQDTTDYGHDLGLKDGLAILLERLTATVPDLDWIRVMYAFPGYVTDRLVDVMATQRAGAAVSRHAAPAC